ncbi:MAG: hypothetical protein ABI128_07920 [Rhodanobacter sp.]
MRVVRHSMRALRTLQQPGMDQDMLVVNDKRGVDASWQLEQSD